MVFGSRNIPACIVIYAAKEAYRHQWVKISTVSIHPAVIDVKVETSASGELELEIFEGESLVSGQEPVASVKKSADGNFQMQLEIPDAKIVEY